MTLTHEHREVRLDMKGHAAHRRSFEKVEDPDYTGEWGEHYYYQEYTKLTTLAFLGLLDGEVFSVMIHDTASSCGNCDEWMSFDLDGEFARSKTACQYTQGITTVVEIDVPSGRLICDDDLRDASGMDVDMDAKGMAGYNSMLGQAQFVEACAAVGLAYGPCLNTSPSLFEIEPGKYVVACVDYDEDTDKALPLSVGGEAVAGFCTDLWAFSMADYDAYLRAGGKTIEEETQNGTRSVIDVPAGRYRMTYHVGEKDFDAHESGENIFAEFERIGDC